MKATSSSNPGKIWYVYDYFHTLPINNYLSKKLGLDLKVLKSVFANKLPAIRILANFYSLIGVTMFHIEGAFQYQNEVEFISLSRVIFVKGILETKEHSKNNNVGYTINISNSLTLTVT